MITSKVVLVVVARAYLMRRFASLSSIGRSIGTVVVDGQAYMGAEAIRLVSARYRAICEGQEGRYAMALSDSCLCIRRGDSAGIRGDHPPVTNLSGGGPRRQLPKPINFLPAI